MAEVANGHHPAEPVEEVEEEEDAVSLCLVSAHKTISYVVVVTVGSIQSP